MFGFIQVLLFLGLLASCSSKWACKKQTEIGAYTEFVHGNRAGKSYLLNDKQILLGHFSYDGSGPYAWFTIGLIGSKHTNLDKLVECENYRVNPVLADENGRCDPKPGKYANRGITLTLPSPYTWKDIAYVGVYCYRFQHLFGYVKIPQAAVKMLDKYEGAAGSSCDTVHKRILGEETRPSTMCK